VIPEINLQTINLAPSSNSILLISLNYIENIILNLEESRDLSQ